MDRLVEMAYRGRLPMRALWASHRVWISGDGSPRVASLASFAVGRSTFHDAEV